jgi:hypothetical protein
MLDSVLFEDTPLTQLIIRTHVKTTARNKMYPRLISKFLKNISRLVAMNTG